MPEYDIGDFEQGEEDPDYQGAEMKRTKQGPSLFRRIAAGAAGGLAGYGGRPELARPMGRTIMGLPEGKKSKRSFYGD